MQSDSNLSELAGHRESLWHVCEGFQETHTASAEDS